MKKAHFASTLLRCEDRTKIGSVTCHQVNIVDESPDPGDGTGSIVCVAKVQPMSRSGGRWSTLEITARGPRPTVVLNGLETVEGRDRRLVEGPIALQWARRAIRFRKVQVRRF